MGEFAALGSAFLWAVSNILMGSQSDRLPASVISALRCVFATLFVVGLAAILVLTGQAGALTGGAALGLAGSGALGVGVGDTLYIRSLRHIGVSRAFPISMAVYPLLTFLLAVPLLGEELSARIGLGSALIIGGVVLVVSGGLAAGDPAAEPRSERERWLGNGLVAGAALLWALASVWLRSASEGVEPAVSQAVRMPAAALVTGLVVYGSGIRPEMRGYSGRTWTALLLTGVVGTGVGSMLFVFAVQQSGAARTAVLSSTAPLFALPMAALLLGERVSGRVIGGTALSIAGIWLVV